MSYQSQPPQPTGRTWSEWATRLNSYLVKVKSQLQHKVSGESATEDGVILFDPSSDHVVVSLNNEFEPLSYGRNVIGQFITNTTQTASAANTPTKITDWQMNSAISSGMYISGFDDERIGFSFAGKYQIDFSCELLSSNSSSKSIYIWPRINGTDIPYSTIVTTVTNNGDSIVVSRSGIFEVDRYDYLEAMFAVTDTNLSIDGSSGTAFAPVSPSASLSVTQLR